jgi:hypothetical protein
MMQPLLAALTAVTLAAALRPDDAPSPPQGPPPKGAVARTASRAIELTEPVSEIVAVERRRVVQVDGRFVTEAYRENVVVYRQVVRRIEAKDVRAFGTDGKEIEAARLAELLQAGLPVLVSADGRPVDPFYLRLLKEGTVILVVGEPAPRGAEPPVPVPAPPGR